MIVDGEGVAVGATVVLIDKTVGFCGAVDGCCVRRVGNGNADVEFSVFT